MSEKSKVNRRIRRMLDAHNLTQTDLAERLGMHRVSLARILRPDNDMRTSTLEKLAEAIGCKVSDFFIDDLGNDKLVAFFHYKGSSHTPSTIAEVMALLQEWHAEEFNHLCRSLSFQMIREEFAQNRQIQELLDNLCALIDSCGGECDCNGNKQISDNE